MAIPLPMSPAPMMPTVRTAAASFLPSAALGAEGASSWLGLVVRVRVRVKVSGQGQG